MRLNIIGNGFDLYHGLPSSYYFFGCYLINNNCEFYEEIARLYNFTFGKIVEPSIAHDYEYVVEDIFWRDFESKLGQVDENFIVDKYEYDLYLENDDPIDIEMNEDKIAEMLKGFFGNWVKETLDRDENYDLISMNMKKIINSFEFTSNDYFLVFNYTHVVQKIYNILDENIHYVHGESLEDDVNELIIGHGNDCRIEEIQKKIKRLEECYDYSQRSNNNINEYSCLLRLLKKLKKDVDWCKYLCESFYKEIHNDVDVIKVYGMSLGEVDIPYLKQIRDRWPNANWEFSYYTDEDETRANEVAENILSINKDKYSVYRLNNILAKEIQSEIVESQNIITYQIV